MRLGRRWGGAPWWSPRRGSARLLSSAFVLSSPTRTSRPVWQGLLVASKRMRTAVTRRQPTPPAATRDASLKVPHTATEPPTLPRERPALGRQASRKDREEGIPRGERPSQGVLLQPQNPSRPHRACPPPPACPGLGLFFPWFLLRRLPQLAALGEWLGDSGCPLAHLWRRTLPAMHCSGAGTSTAVVEAGVGG